jgi:Mycoplasma protein of unknown function, DUF285
VCLFLFILFRFALYIFLTLHSMYTDVSRATTTDSMFRGAAKFNQSLATWELANVTSTYAMFHTATSFDGDVSSFDLSNNRNTGFMFYGASSFTGDLSSWVRLAPAFVHHAALSLIIFQNRKLTHLLLFLISPLEYVECYQSTCHVLGCCIIQQ